LDYPPNAVHLGHANAMGNGKPAARDNELHRADKSITMR